MHFKKLNHILDMNKHLFLPQPLCIANTDLPISHSRGQQEWAISVLSLSRNCHLNYFEVSLGIYLINWIIIFPSSFAAFLSRHMLNKFSIIARNSKEMKFICYVTLRVIEGVLMSSAGTTAEFRDVTNSPSITCIG